MAKTDYKMDLSDHPYYSWIRRQMMAMEPHTHESYRNLLKLKAKTMLRIEVLKTFAGEFFCEDCQGVHSVGEPVMFDWYSLFCNLERKTPDNKERRRRWRAKRDIWCIRKSNPLIDKFGFYNLPLNKHGRSLLREARNENRI